jgi:hypothetical protein
MLNSNTSTTNTGAERMINSNTSTTNTSGACVAV